MKKILYGIIVLLGIGFISTNFIVGTDKLDHKVAKAGGTACKWISDKGSGIAPIFYSEPDSSWWKYEDGHSKQATYANLFTMHLKAVDCSSSNEGQELSAGIVYDQDLNPLTGVILSSGLKALSTSTTRNYFVKLKEGKVTDARYYTSCVALSCGHAGSNCASDEFSNESKSTTLIYEHNLTDNALEEPTKYTCVCAEY